MTVRRRIVAVGFALTMLAGWFLIVRDRVEESTALPGPAVTATQTIGAPDTATPTVTNTAGQALVNLATTYTHLLQAGKATGGPTWVADVQKVASPDLAKAVALTAPDDIDDSSISTVVVESQTADGGGVVTVTLMDGAASRLTARPVGGAVRVVSEENANPNR